MRSNLTYGLGLDAPLLAPHGPIVANKITSALLLSIPPTEFSQCFSWTVEASFLLFLSQSSYPPCFTVKQALQLRLVIWLNKTCPDCNDQLDLQRESTGLTFPPSNTWIPTKKAANISADHTHPGHKLFRLLPSSGSYRVPSAKTAST